MKILFYIARQTLGEPLTQQFAEVLQAAVGRQETVAAATTSAQFMEDVAQAAPDIVHFVGCPEGSEQRIMAEAIRRKLPVVVSTLSRLMPWCRGAGFSGRLKTAQQADALHAWSLLEEAEMRKLSGLERIQMVANSVVTHTVTPEQMASRMITFYQKVIDSNTFRLMNATEKEAETLLLRKSMERDEYSYHLSADDISLLQGLSEDSWRKIIIHATDEDILPLLRQAAEELQLDGINTPTDSVKRFPQKIRKPQGELSTTELIAKNHLTKTVFDNLRVDEKPSPLEMEISVLLYNMHHLLTGGQPLSRHHLVQAYTLLRFNDYDEDKLSRMLSRLKLDRFAARLLCVLDDTFVMGEGFSPLQPLDDKATDRMRQTLADLNIQ